MDETVDGRNPAPPGMHKTFEIMGKTYKPQLVIAGFLNHQRYESMIPFLWNLKNGGLEDDFPLQTGKKLGSMLVFFRGCKYTKIPMDDMGISKH